MRNILMCSIMVGFLLGSMEANAAESSVSDLVKALKAGRESARVEAVVQLGRMGEEAAEAVPNLTKLLKDSSADLRARAAEALGKIGPAAKSAVPELISLVTDPDKTVRREAIEAVHQIGPGPKVSIPLAVKVIEDAEPSVRMRALDALAERGEQAVPFLIEALENKEARYWACLVLGEIGPEAKAAVPALTGLVGADDPQVRREATLALAGVGAASAPAVPALVKALGDQIDRVPATYALGKIGQVPDDVEAKIQENARSADELLSTVSMWALARLHPDDKDLMRRTVRRLAEHLKDEHAEHREAAARALVDLDPDPEIAHSVIKKVMEGASPEVLGAAMDAMASLGKKVLPRLIEALGNEEVRARAADVIRRIGPEAKAAVPALIEALEDRSAETRNEVLFALAAVGPDARQAVPAVTKALKDPDMNVRYAACFALGKIGADAVAAKPELQKNLSGPDQFLSMASAWALAQICPDCQQTAPMSVPVLIKALGEPDPITRLHAAECLCCLGPLAKDAVPALKKALEDQNEDVQAAAAEALEAIGR